MSHGHLVEETDFFSHCYPKDKGEHKETEGLSSQSKRQKVSVFLCHSLIRHSLPLSSSPQLPSLSFFSSSLSVKIQLHWRDKERERERVRVREAEWKKKAKEKCTSKLWSGAELFASWKTKPLNPFPEANSESIHVAIYLSLSLSPFISKITINF